MSERRPRWVYRGGDEPDPRYTLANERTFLAWVRTGLAVLAGAVALNSLEVPSPQLLRVVVVAVLLLFAGLMTALAYARWARVERALRHHAPLPSFALGLWVTVAVVAVAALLTVAVVAGPG